MAILTTEEIQAAMADLYKAKQALHALDRQFNVQAATIMSTARQDVENMRAGLSGQRQGILDTLTNLQQMLDEGK